MRAWGWCWPVQIVVGALADARDAERGYSLEHGNDVAYFRDKTGKFFVQSQGVIFTTYYKVYVDKENSELARVMIPSEDGQALVQVSQICGRIAIDPSRRISAGES